MQAKTVKKKFLDRFGAAYQDFGLPTLMGRIVGLLIYHEEALSLDDITKELKVSKGPVSQILRRLRDHELVDKIIVEGDRKDYYKATDHIFLQAFSNQTRLFKKNLELARDFREKASQVDDIPQHFIGYRQQNPFDFGTHRDH